MKKIVIAVAILTFLAVSGVSAKTLIPLPGEVDILPDFPNAQVSSYYDFGLDYWETAITTEWIRHKGLYSYVGWTTNKKRWVVGAGADLPDFLKGEGFLGVYKIGIKFFLSYGLTAENMEKRILTAGIGFDWIDGRMK